MNIELNRLISPLIANNESFISTREKPPQLFSFQTNIDNIYAFNSTPVTLLDEQFRLERDIANQSAITTEDSFVTTYSSLHTIFSQMQIKLASAFLQETEYLKQREEQLDKDEDILTKHEKQIYQIENERQQLEKDFQNLQEQLNEAIDYISRFQTDGERILQILFAESRQIDNDLSALICQCLTSLGRCRTMIDEKINDFSLKSTKIQSNLIDRENQIRHTQLTITLMLELVKKLNEQNLEHSNELTVAIRDLEKKSQDLDDKSETIQMYWNIQKELNEIHHLEKEKHQLRKELFEQTMLLENINTIIGKAVIN